VRPLLIPRHEQSTLTYCQTESEVLNAAVQLAFAQSVVQRLSVEVRGREGSMVFHPPFVSDDQFHLEFEKWEKNCMWATSDQM
jgi:hypothetical protein